jgi:lipoate synthase
MLKKYQVPFVLRDNVTVERKIAVVRAETKYQASLIVLGNYVATDSEGVSHGESLATVDYDNIVEIVEIG